MDYTIHRILQARILEWVAIPFSRSSQPRDQTQVSHIAGGFLPAELPEEAVFNEDQSLKKKSDIWKWFSKEMRKHHIELKEEASLVCGLSHQRHVHIPHWFFIDPR